MTLGTKSVLYGAHQFILHPLVLFYSWWKVYGFRRTPDGFTLLDPRVWVAIVVHDLGYIGKPNMDGPEGEEHPYLGATIMSTLFGERWYRFTLCHSRYLAKRNGWPISSLCVADKRAIVDTPLWLYLPMTRLTGELDEYMSRATKRVEYNKQATAFERASLTSGDAIAWARGVKAYLVRWVDEHKDLKPDTWTAVTPKEGAA